MDGEKDNVIAEDKINVQTHFVDSPYMYLSSNHYYGLADVNGKNIYIDSVQPSELLDSFEKTLDRLHRKARALNVVNSHEAAQALANDMLKDIAILIAIARAMAHRAKD
jgi:hypothetical protein